MMYEFENVAAVGWWTTGQMAPLLQLSSIQIYKKTVSPEKNHTKCKHVLNVIQQVACRKAKRDSKEGETINNM